MLDKGGGYCSVIQLCWIHMDCSTPGLPALHHLLELAQTHVHRVGDAIQPSHSLSSLLFQVAPASAPEGGVVCVLAQISWPLVLDRQLVI